MMEVTDTVVSTAGQADLEGGAGEGEVDRIEADLVAVDDAMVRLDDRTYGTCATCGVVLADEILAASPTARTCPDHR